ncbi:TPA: DASS family sodium-coupled anion symporter [Serratia fonticola]|uniref:DASS family sodium-coupled anion symporter n=1 Tax=Serratia TaxID=613 RepID=UPI000EF48D5F|nr:MULTISPECIES: DASS family sodium-coupled anion symporter [Serratia]AYM91486.1 DASS family sodium-coupled anion symporter [Serratia sp. 3ACOL1]MBL5905828.1 DASS family sodium-coupled anion symporter [Serratia fonticola]MDK2377019.1 DASS family sodium-coupled anion symporter [Serratia fonticola]CAI1816496.1 Inner membrane protein ybhI [Serratia fonticola]CAI1985734.1 Inner membrane protein ybhI [Serratia fonticola]
MSAGSPDSKKKAIATLIPLLLGLAIWFYPVPEGLTPQAWQMFAIFAATIAAILTQPLPSGAVMLVALCVAIFTGTLTEAKALSGFASGTVWLIFCAYILSLGFVTSGLGKRIAYKMLSLFGGSSLGIAYSLGVSDLIMAPAMPSVTARSGGIIFPIVRSINEVLGSAPGKSGKKIGDFLIMVCFQFTPITGAIFLTGMAANPLVGSLAKDSLGVEITWGGWFVAAVVPAMVCFFLMPLLVYKILNPELKKTPEAKDMGRRALNELGAMSGVEKKVALGFILALLGWGTSLLTGLSATTVGLGLAAYLFATHAVSWKDLLKDQAAWDTVIWFSVIISLAGGLSSLGFISWMTTKLETTISGFGAMQTFVILGILYIYVHYLFATASGHVAALYAPFAATAIAAGAPPMMVAICFGIFSNLMWGNTEYGGGPGPIYFAQGYFERPRFYKINFCVVTFNVILIFVVGLAWWKLLGYY